MAKKRNRELVTPPAKGIIPEEKIVEAVNNVLKEESAKKKRAKKQPAKKTAKRKKSCRHTWKILRIWIESKKLIVQIKCEKCALTVTCEERGRFMTVHDIHSFFTF